MNKKLVDNIVWYIPIKKLRNYLRNYLTESLILKQDVNSIKQDLRNIALEKHILNGEKIAPIGHYESPYPLKEELTKGYKNLVLNDDSMYGINLNAENQMALYNYLSVFFDDYKELFQGAKNDNNRFYFRNNWFGYGCGLYLYSLIRHIKPRNILEIGSGFSTSLMLDINDKYFDNSIKITSIEPRPERLKELLRPSDDLNILEKEQQEIDIDIFKTLKENDLLFIDSSHVARPFGDVNRQFSEILPNLNKGVYIHLHDIMWPFEYPSHWTIDQRRAYSEAYSLRAFLQYNDTFEIVIWPSYLQYKNKNIQNGGSIYLRKIK